MESPIENSPSQEDGSFWTAKAKEASDMGEYRAAITYFDNALALEPSNAIIWFNKGITFEKWG
jgi:tetratricopeptide (TPR) repeat protein